MKTTTYLRFSLLIPFVVWAISLLSMVALDSLENVTPGLPENVSFGLSIFFMAYVLGIIFWIFPYLLLALILFFSTFISRVRTALLLFAFSPFAMLVLTMATVILMDQGTASSGEDLIGLLLLASGLAVGWGYICVGIGYGIYKLLQRRGTIRDEGLIQARLQPV